MEIHIEIVSLNLITMVSTFPFAVHFPVNRNFLRTTFKTTYVFSPEIESPYARELYDDWISKQFYLFTGRRCGSDVIYNFLAF